ncbi:MAG TPA: hypothetical protein VMU28_04560 [Terriglobales bacterium]|nr:hypothetical protein [Terriglobales bacterium]
MAAEIVFVGYICGFCGGRVVVLRSSDPPTKVPKEICSECDCGALRVISLEELQTLEVWKETPGAA